MTLEDEKDWHAKFKEKIAELRSQYKPIPMAECTSCGGTIFQREHWLQCPDCGALSTSYGGSYDGDADDEWKKACNESKEFLGT